MTGFRLAQLWISGAIIGAWFMTVVLDSAGRICPP